VLSARGSSRTKSEDQRRCTEDRYDFHWSSVDCLSLAPVGPAS
jgi:hypothetical protein